MSKKEFLTLLRNSLEGYIPQDEVEENIAYYQTYFQESEESEKTLIEELGDPRLIARTIIDAYKASKGPMADYYTEQARSEYSKAHSAIYEEETKAEKTKRVKHHLTWILTLAGGVVLLLFLLAILGTVIAYLFPVIIVVLIILILLGVFRD